MTNEQNKKPNVADSVARSIKRLEERIGSTERSIHLWLNQLEGIVRGSMNGVIERLGAGEEPDEDEDEDDE